MELVTPETVGFSSERLARIAPRMNQMVESGKYAGIQTFIARNGYPVHWENVGYSSLEDRAPLQNDSIFRIYSMSKPITTVAVMLLLEEGRFLLNDPVSRYLPEFAEMQVITGSSGDELELTPAKNPITIRHLLCHSAGLSYGFDENDPLDKLYQKFWKKIEALEQGESPVLEGAVREVAKLPLRFEPGTSYHYSFAIDVLGRLVEVISGQPFDVFLQQRIFEPLEMVDTSFWVAPDKAARLARMYTPDKDRQNQLKDADPHAESSYTRPVKFFSGGGGLLSTTSDYFHFCQMILSGGQWQGKRLLSRKSIELMDQNHLAEGVLLDPGRGFGLGGYVALNTAPGGTLGSVGNWGWGGAANTKFWVDFREGIVAILMTQLMTDNNFDIEPLFMNLVYQALAD